MLGVVLVLHRIQREAWVSRFVEGLTPAVAVLILTVAWKIFRGSSNDAIGWQSLALGGAGLVALLLEVPAPIVLLICGFVGTILFR
jgi:chromate transport protein ChrA